jgi:hypothetical protein
VEPLCAAEIADDPDEIDLGEARGGGVVEVVHSVPDVFEDRGEGGYADSGADEEDRFVLTRMLVDEKYEEGMREDSR